MRSENRHEAVNLGGVTCDVKDQKLKINYQTTEKGQSVVTIESMGVTSPLAYVTFCVYM